MGACRDVEKVVFAFLCKGFIHGFRYVIHMIRMLEIQIQGSNN